MLAPFRLGRFKPALINAAPIGIETKLPGAVQVQPIVTFDGAAAPIGPRIFRPRIREKG